MIRIGPKTIIFIIILILIPVAFILGILFQVSNTGQKTTAVNSQVILNKINDQAILLTKTIYLDQESTISIDTGSDWSNLWWGQEIFAEALMKVNIGVDLNQLTEENIIIDNTNKTISIKLPEAKIQDTSLSGKIKVTTKTGVLKFLFENDPNEDYNLAIEQLKKDANSAVTEELLNNAKTEAGQIIMLILKDLDYSVKIV